MTDKQQFLETVRVALRDGIPPNLLRPLPDTPNDPIEYTPDLSDTLGAFIRSKKPRLNHSWRRYERSLSTTSSAGFALTKSSNSDLS